MRMFGMSGISLAEQYPLCGYIMRMFGISGISMAEHYPLCGYIIRMFGISLTEDYPLCGYIGVTHCRFRFMQHSFVKAFVKRKICPL